MIIVFLTLLFVLFLLFILSAGKYRTCLNETEDREYRLKKLLPAGLFVLDTLKRKYTSPYDRKLLSALSELYGSRNVLLRLKLHLAGRIVILLLTVLSCTLVGVLSKPDGSYAFFSAMLAGGALYFPDRELFNKVNKRRMAIKRDFPDFVNKLALLINAGMTVQNAWEKASYGTDRTAPLYLELTAAIQDIKAGKPEHRAYEEFAKRCRTPEITRFISVILQNLRKGNSELVPILRVFSVDCWEMRKNTAKRYGEEASVKLLLPMMLMFFAILLIVGMPAVISLRSI